MSVEYFKLISFLLLSLVGLRFLSRGLQGVFSSVHRVSLHWISDSFISGWFWGTINQLVSLSALSNLLYVNSFTASGIFRARQAIGYSVSYLFSYLMIALITWGAVHLDSGVLIVSGVILWRQVFVDRLRILGVGVAGLGIYAFGVQSFLEVLAQVFARVDSYSIFHLIADNSPSAVLGVLFCSAAVSFAVPGFGLSLVFAILSKMAGFVSYEGFLAIICGQALAESLVVLLASRNLTRTAKQLSASQILNIILVFLIAWASLSVVNFRGMMGLLFLLTAMWLISTILAPLTWRMKIFPELAQKEMQKLKFSHPLLRMVPSLGIEHIHNEVRKMTAMVQTLFDLTKLRIVQQNGDLQRILKYQKIIGNIRREINEYASELTQTSLNHDEARQVRQLFRVTESLDVIADNCVAICQFIDSHLEDDERRVLQTYFGQLAQLYEDIFPDHTSRDLLELPSSLDDVRKFSESLNENQAAISGSFPRLINVFMRFRFIASRIETIDDA